MVVRTADGVSARREGGSLGHVRAVVDRLAGVGVVDPKAGAGIDARGPDVCSDQGRVQPGLAAFRPTAKPRSLGAVTPVPPSWASRAFLIFPHRCAKSNCRSSREARFPRHVARDGLAAPARAKGLTLRAGEVADVRIALGKERPPGVEFSVPQRRDVPANGRSSRRRLLRVLQGRRAGPCQMSCVDSAAVPPVIWFRAEYLPNRTTRQDRRDAAG